MLRQAQHDVLNDFLNSFIIREGPMHSASGLLFQYNSLLLLLHKALVEGFLSVAHAQDVHAFGQARHVQLAFASV